MGCRTPTTRRQSTSPPPDSLLRPGPAASRRARVTRLSLAAVCIFMALGWFAINQVRSTGLEHSIALATAVEAQSDAQHHDRAIRLAIVAVRSSLLAPRANEADPALTRASRASPSIIELRGHTAAINMATFSPDGARVVTAGEAAIWGMSNKTLRAWLVGFGFGVPAAASITCCLNILEPARTE